MYKAIRLIIATLALAHAASSYGLADASAPTKMQIPFANSAGGAYIRTVPIASQIGIQNGAASYTDGFPPLNFAPVSSGGVPPFGQDMNGILNAITTHTRWWAAGGPVYYDGTYQTAIGGYPKGAMVQSAVTTGLFWVSTTENNTTNPDTGGAGWVHPDGTIYAPLTGTGASGTWGISITGNAATATSATSATNATNVVGSGTISSTTTGGASLTPSHATTSTNLSGGTVSATSIDASGHMLCSDTAVGIGYNSGSGSSVTQSTSKVTAVTMSTLTGKITTAADALAGGATATFSLGLPNIGAADIVMAQIYAPVLHYTVAIENCTSVGNTCQVNLRNITGGSLSEAVQIKVSVFKGGN